MQMSWLRSQTHHYRKSLSLRYHSDISLIAEAVRVEKLQPTSYGETYKQSLTAKAIAAGDKDVKIELPEQALTASIPEYREELAVLKADIMVILKSKHEESETRVSSTESNLAELNKRLKYSATEGDVAVRIYAKLAEMDAKIKSLDISHGMTHSNRSKTYSKNEPNGNH
jgi:hypothetical protein